MKLSILLALSTAVFAQPAVNPHALLIQEFEKRTSEYLKLHKQAEGKMPRLKPTESPAAIGHHERELAEKIRKARPNAKVGNIFTSEIAGEFRRLIGLAMQGAEAAHIRASLARAEPVRGRLRVNQTYPANVPLQSTPPSLLLNLPALPPDLDYRVVGRDLVLRDVKANMVVDYVPNAIS